MNKIKRFVFISLLAIICQVSFAQKISKKEAQQLLEKTITCLKTADTTAFANLWYIDDTGRPYDKSVFTRKHTVEEFNELKVFLDTALAKNWAFDYVDVDDFKSWSKYKVKYKIKAWYKYDEKLKYYKGFGVLVDFIEGKWAFRFTFEHSTSYRDK
jgi:hypothetical protein